MKRLVLLAVAAAVLLVPSTALASGVVLKVQKATHLVAVAQSPTRVALVHTTAATRLHVGQRVALSGRTLKNGTLAASGVRVVGRAHSVRFRALVLKRTSGRLVVSANGAVISLKRGGRALSSARDSGPQPGVTVDVTATVGSDDELDEDDATTVSSDHPGGAIEGTITLGTGKITVVSEHMALVIGVPAGFDLSNVKSGDEVLAKFDQQGDGTLILTAISNDEDEQGANDEHEGDDSDG